MMNPHATRRRCAGAIPSGVKEIESRVGHLIQFDQGKIDVRLRSAKSRAALILRERTTAVLAAGGRLEIPIDRHTGSIPAV